MIKSTLFTKRYGVSNNTVYTMFNSTNNPFIVKEKIGGALFVNETKLLARREFNIRVWNEATSNFYEITDTIRPWCLAKEVSKKLGGSQMSWQVFFNRGLFSTAFKDKSLIAYKTNTRLWKFWRFSRQYLRDIKNEEK